MTKYHQPSFNLFIVKLPVMTTVLGYGKRAEYGERINFIVKNPDELLLRDSRGKTTKKTKYDIFWDIAEKLLDEIMAVKDRGHS